MIFLLFIIHVHMYVKLKSGRGRGAVLTEIYPCILFDLYLISFSFLGY